MEDLRSSILERTVGYTKLKARSIQEEHLIENKMKITINANFSNTSVTAEWIKMKFDVNVDYTYPGFLINLPRGNKYHKVTNK